MINLTDEQKAHLAESIKRYFRENLDQDIGELKAMLMLDFILKEVGPTIYNKAVLDSQAFVQDKLSDLDAACFLPEYSFWQDKKPS